jgi:hypothetical protein
MRKTVLLAAIWLAAAVGALAAASVGVSMVGSQVTGDRPAPLSASEVREELRSAASTTIAAAPTGSVPASSAGAGGADAGDAVGGGAATSTAAPPAPTSTVSGPAPSSPTTVAGPATPTASEVRTYHLHGGTATLRFEPAGVTVVAATPEPGFSVSIEPEDGTGVQVDFEGHDHRSRVTGWWAGGPQDETREDD